MKILSGWLVLGMLLCGAGPAGAGEGALVVVDPWIRAAPPAAQALAVYLTLKNPGRQEQVVVGMRSPLFSKVELHATVTKDGVSRMEARERLPVPAAGEVSMAPGGLHGMLLAPQKVLQPQDRVPMTLLLSDGTRVEFEAEVRAGPGGGHGAHPGH
ncbi:MAG: copper chaperone PCu(A)C [Magnetococcales bacterium]|nr:copper chaperone PCu(A)C [Magnetococcales bacterium]